MSNSSLVVYTNLSPNCSKSKTHAIDRITIHCMVAQWTAKQACDYFSSASVRASCNYAVGRDGSIGLCVDEEDRSWCSSNSSNDNRAVTIEVASDTSHPYAVNDKAYEALIELVADICKRNGKNKILWFGDKDKTLAYEPKSNEMVMTVHRWFDAKACPGDYLYSRHGDIAQKVNEKLSGVEQKMFVKIDVADKAQAEKLVKLLKNAEIVEVQAEVKPTPAPAPAAPVTPKKTVDELAQEVWAGKWGNGDEREQRLSAAGYDYRAVQNRVNELYG